MHIIEFDPTVKSFMHVLLFTLSCISVTKLEIYNFSPAKYFVDY